MLNRGGKFLEVPAMSATRFSSHITESEKCDIYSIYDIRIVHLTQCRMWIVKGIFIIKHLVLILFRRLFLPKRASKPLSILSMVNFSRYLLYICIIIVDFSFSILKRKDLPLAYNVMKWNFRTKAVSKKDRCLKIVVDIVDRQILAYNLRIKRRNRFSIS